jgi:hypothetical protein
MIPVGDDSCRYGSEPSEVAPPRPRSASAPSCLLCIPRETSTSPLDTCPKVAAAGSPRCQPTTDAKDNNLRGLSQFDRGKKVPATVSAIADAVRLMLPTRGRSRRCGIAFGLRLTIRSVHSIGWARCGTPLTLEPSPCLTTTARSPLPAVSVPRGISARWGRNETVRSFALKISRTKGGKLLQRLRARRRLRL